MQPGERIWKLAYAATLVVLTVLVVGSFLRIGVNRFPRAMFPDMVQGTAHKPFVYRALVPFVVRHVSASVPEGVRDGIDRYVRDPLLAQPPLARLKLNLDTVDWTELLAAVMVWYLSVLGFAWAFKKLARSVYRMDERFLDVLALTAVAALPTLFRYYSYIYDFTHLFLFTACLVALKHERWQIYLPLFVLATFSKETSALLIPVCALACRRSLPGGRLAAFLGVQVLIFVGIKWLLAVHFAANPGGFVRFNLLQHNLWMHPYRIPQFVALGIIAAGVARDWASKPLFLRQCFVVIAPVLLFLGLFLGYFDEYRIYYEAYPLVLLLLAPVVAQLLAIRPLESMSVPGVRPGRSVDPVGAESVQ
jgi:hypothetical protein